MYMKLNMWTILFTFLFIIVITIALCGSCATITPHYQDTIFPRYSNFNEGFTSNMRGNKYTNILDKTKNDTYNNYLISKPETECDKIFGFNGLLCNKNIDTKLDAFADAPGKITWQSALSNSKGPLCLSAHHMKLLSSRGGNRSGGNSDY